jgi:hypothetical protein
MTGTRAQRPGRRVDPHVRIGKSGQGGRCGRPKGLTFLFTDGFPLRVGGDEIGPPSVGWITSRRGLGVWLGPGIARSLFPRELQ